MQRNPLGTSVSWSRRTRRTSIGRPDGLGDDAPDGAEDKLPGLRLSARLTADGHRLRLTVRQHSRRLSARPTAVSRAVSRNPLAAADRLSAVSRAVSRRSCCDHLEEYVVHLT